MVKIVSTGGLAEDSAHYGLNDHYGWAVEPNIKKTVKPKDRRDAARRLRKLRMDALKQKGGKRPSK